MPKISQLTALTVPDSGDELPIVDVTASTTKKITRENLLKGAPIPGGTEFAGSSGVYSDAIYKTTSGTYAKPADLKFIIVEVVGGGGSGGGTQATGASTRAGSSGGGGGGYSRKKILASALAGSETVTIGTGGSAPSAGNNPGNAGGTTSFGTHLQATGGSGGNGGAASSGTTGASYGGEPGVGSGGDFNVYGNAGGSSQVSGGFPSSSGSGGGTILAGAVAVSNNTTGNAGSNYGGGGSGCASGVNQPARAGGAGADGIVIIHEYF